MPTAPTPAFFAHWFAHRQSGRRVLAGGVLLIAALVVGAAALMWQDYRRTTREHLQQLELVASVTQAFATQALDGSNAALDSLARDLTASGASLPGQSSQIEALMASRQASKPWLVSITLMDQQGRVIVSTTAAERGQQARLPAQLLSTGLGWVPGRLLIDPAPAAEDGEGFVALARPVTAPGQAPVWLVARLSPGALIPPLAGLAQINVLVALTDGTLLARSGDSARLPGQSLAPHPVFDEAAPPGASQGAQPLWDAKRMGAWQASARLPVVSIASQPRAFTLQQSLQGLRGPLLFMGLAAVLIGLLTRLAWRNARMREGERQALDAAQEESARRGQQLALLVKSVHELIFRTDASGNIRFANARWQAVTGEGAHLARGRHLSDVVLAQHREQVDALFAPDGAPGVRMTQASVQGPDDHVRVLDISVVPLTGRDGTLRGYAGSAVDVTELLAAQQQLQEQLAFTELVLECNPLPICLTDTQGRFITVNQAWENFMGLSRSEVLGRCNTDFLPPQEAQAYDAHTEQLLHRGGRVRYQERLHRPDGSARSVQITKVPLLSGSKEPLGILTTKLDITEFLAARDMAEEASRTKSEFVANISHELRTPLQSILGFSELGLMRGREHPKLAAMFGDIHAAGQRMLELVNDLLDIAKIESTVGAFHFERTDVRDLIEDVTAEMGLLFQRKQLQLQLELGRLPLYVKVDPLRFRQVVRNVLSNALKFSPEGARIAISAGVQGGGAVHIQVRDHGPGIPPAELEAVFEAFVQSSQTRDGSGGTGLGLAICRKIITAHGGRIHATNAQDGGTVFHIQLPTASYSDTMPAPLT